MLCFKHLPALTRVEIAAFRYRVLHVAARLVCTARRVELRIDRTWRWAEAIAEGFHRLRSAFTVVDRACPCRSNPGNDRPQPTDEQTGGLRATKPRDPTPQDHQGDSSGRPLPM
jgi:hypothetical protein